MHKNAVRVCMVAALVVAAATMRASSWLPADFPSVVKDASLVVFAAVSDVRAVRTASGEVETVATLRIHSALKGSAGTFVSMRLPGGTFGRYRTVVPGTPTLTVGQNGVFFLKRSATGEWWPVGLASGIYRVTRDGTQLLVTPPVVAGVTTTADAPVTRGDVRRRPMPLGTFEALVRAASALDTERR